MKTKVLEDEVMLLKAKEEEFIAEKKRVEKMNEEIKVLKEQLLEKEQKQVSEEKKKKNETDGEKKKGGNSSKVTESVEEDSSSDKETENDTDTDLSDFHLDKDVLTSHKEKAFDEITSVDKKLALRKTENPNKEPVIQRVYTIKQFVYDNIEAGFSYEYRATTKMTSQNATRGDNVRKTMKSLDLEHIINLTKKVWTNLPGWSLIQIEIATRTAI